MILSIILQFIIIALIIVLVLLQSSNSDGFSSFTSGYNTVFSTKGTSSFLARMTWVCVTIFFLNSILLSKFYGATKARSIIDKIEEDKFEQTLQSKPQIPVKDNIINDQ
jgi:preprotein translocase subunit SecG